MAVLAQADRGPILKVLGTVAGKPASEWLVPGHLAADGQLPRSWAQVASAGLTSAHFVEACAVSGPNHCVDGWSYAARSISALLAGDLHATRHLAYYAQLRAALSILAGLGVGIFNKINFIVNAAGEMTGSIPGVKVSVLIRSRGRSCMPGQRTLTSRFHSWISSEFTACLFATRLVPFGPASHPKMSPGR